MREGNSRLRKMHVASGTNNSSMGKKAQLLTCHFPKAGRLLGRSSLQPPYENLHGMHFCKICVCPKRKEGFKAEGEDSGSHPRLDTHTSLLATFWPPPERR